MSRKNNTKTHISVEDYIKASKKGNRLAEMELYGPGFHSFNRIHHSRKMYTRKPKHKKEED